jgi:hypothetical protein
MGMTSLSRSIRESANVRGQVAPSLNKPRAQQRRYAVIIRRRRGRGPRADKADKLEPSLCRDTIFDRPRQGRARKVTAVVGGPSRTSTGAEQVECFRPIRVGSLELRALLAG